MAKYLSFIDEQFDRRSWPETALNVADPTAQPTHSIVSFSVAIWSIEILRLPIERIKVST